MRVGGNTPGPDVLGQFFTRIAMRLLLFYVDRSNGPVLPSSPRLSLGGIACAVRNETPGPRHHPSGAWCQCLMTPRHPAARLLDRRAAHRIHGAPIGRHITAIQPLLWFVPNSLRVRSSPGYRRTYSGHELRRPYDRADRRHDGAVKARHLGPTE